MNVGTSRHRGDRGEPLRHLVLVVGDLRLEVVAHAAEQVARGLEALGRAQELVVGVGELELAPRAGRARTSSSSTRPSTILCTASRSGERNWRMWSRSWRRSETCPRILGAGPRLDVLLELVDLVVQVVDQVEPALGDLVDQAEERTCRPAPCGLHAPFGPASCRTVLVRRRLRHRQQLLGGEDEVDLLVVDGVLGRDRHGDDEDAEDVGRRGSRAAVAARRSVHEWRREQLHGAARGYRPGGARGAPPASGRRSSTQRVALLTIHLAPCEASPAVGWSRG